MKPAFFSLAVDFTAANSILLKRLNKATTFIGDFNIVECLICHICWKALILSDDNSMHIETTNYCISLSIGEFTMKNTCHSL